MDPRLADLDSTARLWWHRITGLVVILSSTFAVGFVAAWFSAR